MVFQNLLTKYVPFSVSRMPDIPYDMIHCSKMMDALCRALVFRVGLACFCLEYRSVITTSYRFHEAAFDYRPSMSMVIDSSGLLPGRASSCLVRVLFARFHAHFPLAVPFWIRCWQYEARIPCVGFYRTCCVLLGVQPIRNIDARI